MQNNSPRLTEINEPGFFKLTLAKGGAEVGAIMFFDCPMDPYYGFPMDRPRHLRAQINGQDVDSWQLGTRVVERISQAEYEFLIADRAWAKEYDQDSPEANPYRSVVTTPKAKAETPVRTTVNIREIPLSNFMP